MSHSSSGLSIRISKSFAHTPLSRQTTVRIAPVAVIRRQVTPWRTGAHDPENRVDKTAGCLWLCRPNCPRGPVGAVPAIPFLALTCRVCDVMLLGSCEILLKVYKNFIFSHLVTTMSSA